MAKKVFIDCGANNGSSIELFLSKYPNASKFEIHSFECNPKLVQQLNQKYPHKNFPSIFIYNKAVSIKDGESNFYIGNHLSSSLRVDKKTGGIKYNNPFKVVTVDLHNFIVSNFSQEDYIILKLDIEGSEYDILPHLLQQNTFTFVNELFGEWHWTKLKNVSQLFHDELEKKLLEKGVMMKKWCAEKKYIQL